MTPDTLAAIVARDAEWEPSCQYVKADAETAKGYGQFGGQHPWPMTVAQALDYGKLCGVRRIHHPAKFIGPQWNHDEFVYDSTQDPSIAADRRALLALLRETRDDITAVVNDSESQHPGGWGPDVTTVAFLRDVLARLAALDTEVPA